MYRYAIYFTWNDGTQDSFNVESAKERDMNIRDMVSRKEFSEIRWCRIYASGEYGAENVAYRAESKYELVLIWDTGEREITAYPTEADAKRAGRNMRMAFGKQVAWCGTRPKRG